MSENTLYSKFKNDVKLQTKNESFQKVLEHNLENYALRYSKEIDDFPNLNAFKEKLKFLRTQSTLNLEKNLLQFETNFKKNGGEVFWADDIEDVYKLLEHITDNNLLKNVIKSKSKVIKEIKLNEFLKSKKTQYANTDFSEYINRLENKKYSQNNTDTLHLSKEDIASLFDEKLENTSDIINFIRKEIRKSFLSSEIGISGADFLIADSGSVVLIENEGNLSLLSSCSKTHIIIADINKVLYSFSHLSTILPLFSVYKTGQKFSAYHHLISGPKQEEEIDGPERTIVILLNNNRNKLLIDKHLRYSLNCINCDACSHHSLTYKIIGSRAYNSEYTGVIGSIITPHLKDEKNYFHLSFANNLCEKSMNICPVKIPLKDLLLYNRHLAVKHNKIPKSEIRLIKLLNRILKSRRRMNQGSAAFRNLLFKIVFRKNWSKKRAYPEFPKESFNKKMRGK